jgi:hypothetical protein
MTASLDFLHFHQIGWKSGRPSLRVKFLHESILPTEGRGVVSAHFPRHALARRIKSAQRSSIEVDSEERNLVLDFGPLDGAALPAG